LIVGQGLEANNSKRVAIGGFHMQAGDNAGQCLNTDNTLNSYPAERLDFRKAITMSCSVEFADVTAFEAYCTSGDLANKTIFKQLKDKFRNLGKFGNVNISKNEDWLEVIDETGTDFAGEYDAASQSCTLPASMYVEIIHSLIGFDSFPQSYIVGAKMASHT
jgi:hypothetical protein